MNNLNKQADDLTIKSYFEGVDYTTQNVDNFASPVGEAKCDNRGGSNKRTYFLTVSCLEHLIARLMSRFLESIL